MDCLSPQCLTLLGCIAVEPVSCSSIIKSPGAKMSPCFSFVRPLQGRSSQDSVASFDFRNIHRTSPAPSPSGRPTRQALGSSSPPRIFSILPLQALSSEALRPAPSSWIPRRRESVLSRGCHPPGHCYHSRGNAASNCSCLDGIGQDFSWNDCWYLSRMDLQHGAPAAPWACLELVARCGLARSAGCCRAGDSVWIWKLHLTDNCHMMSQLETKAYHLQSVALRSLDHLSFMLEALT